MHALMKFFHVLSIGFRVGRNLDHESNRDAIQLMTMQYAAVAQEDISPVSTQTTTANTWSPVMFLRFSRVTVVTHERIVQSHAVDDPTRALVYTSDCQPPVSRSASFCEVRVSSHGYQLSRRATREPPLLPRATSPPWKNPGQRWTAAETFARFLKTVWTSNKTRSPVWQSCSR